MPATKQWITISVGMTGDMLDDIGANSFSHNFQKHSQMDNEGEIRHTLYEIHQSQDSRGRFLVAAKQIEKNELILWNEAHGIFISRINKF